MEALSVDDSDLEYTGLQYMCTQYGITRLMVAVISFITFVSNESVTWCEDGKFFCKESLYQGTYQYYSAISFGTCLTYTVLTVLHYKGFYQKLRCSFQKKVTMELLFASTSTILYAFGNAFMASRTDNRANFITAIVFGCVTMIILIIHLVFLISRFHFVFIGNDVNLPYKVKQSVLYSVGKKHGNVREVELQESNIGMKLKSIPNTPPIASSSPIKGCKINHGAGESPEYFFPHKNLPPIPYGKTGKETAHAKIKSKPDVKRKKGKVPVSNVLLTPNMFNTASRYAQRHEREISSDGKHIYSKNNTKIDDDEEIEQNDKCSIFYSDSSFDSTDEYSEFKLKDTPAHIQVNL